MLVSRCNGDRGYLKLELEKINKKISFLIQKVTERDEISGVVLGDKPPHW